MSVSDAEAKWEKAKKAVDKSKYPENDAYYAVVTKIFKNMMHEIMSFREWDASHNL